MSGNQVGDSHGNYMEKGGTTDCTVYVTHTSAIPSTAGQHISDSWTH